jgi:hypothetical protein
LETQALEVADVGDIVVLKSENGGALFTILSRRQSHPSENTILIHYQTMEKSANTFADFRGAVHAESDLRP